jgi:hypothetical protein
VRKERDAMLGFCLGLGYIERIPIFLVLILHFLHDKIGMDLNDE